MAMTSFDEWKNKNIDESVVDMAKAGKSFLTGTAGKVMDRLTGMLGKKVDDLSNSSQRQKYIDTIATQIASQINQIPPENKADLVKLLLGELRTKLGRLINAKLD
jgi:hypothetical protein